MECEAEETGFQKLLLAIVPSEYCYLLGDLVFLP